jgi:hypothetical protein
MVKYKMWSKLKKYIVERPHKKSLSLVYSYTL